MYMHKHITYILQAFKDKLKDLKHNKTISKAKQLKKAKAKEENKKTRQEGER